MKATIFIRGVGMVFEDEGVWKVIFPFDECHTVKFKESDQDPGISLAAPGGGKVSIRAVEPSSSFAVGDDFDDFIDLTADKAHCEGVVLKDKPDPFVLLSIQNARLSVGEHTFCRYHLLDGDYPVSELKEVAYSAKAEIESRQLVVEAEGVEGFPKTFDGADSIVLTFDNICPPEEDDDDETDEDLQEEPVSDLKLLYGIMQDARGNGKEFTIDRAEDEKPGNAPPPEPGTPGLSQRDNDNLLPGEPGLPCNVVKGEKPRNM